ncbi:MAG: NTP transferase domain-containing protein [Candidatus Hydrogenedentes bacterium]|nr:NTP transferase domain-containing protein [Candidatus Hydrogenedentota bacterium]
MSSPCQGVILAAGHGARMGAIADRYPKALLPVCNIPLIHRHLDTLRRLGVRDVIIVVGHLGDQIRQALGNGEAWRLSITYAEQTDRQGLAHAVGQLEAYLDRPFYLLLGDIYFEFDHLDALRAAFETHRAAVALAVREDEDLDAVRRNFSVETDAAGRVSRLIEKPAHPPTRCKGCGLYLADRRLFDAIRETPRSALRNEYELTDAIQRLVEHGAPVHAVPMVAWDMNITEPNDLVTCSVRELARRGLPHLLGHDCRLAPGCAINGSVLGDGVRVLHPIRLERCVVLPGTIVDATEDYTGVLIAP